MECSFCSEMNNKKENNFFDIYLKEEFENAGLENRIVATTKKICNYAYGWTTSSRIFINCS